LLFHVYNTDVLMEHVVFLSLFLIRRIINSTKPHFGVYFIVSKTLVNSRIVFQKKMQRYCIVHTVKHCTSSKRA